MTTKRFRLGAGAGLNRPVTVSLAATLLVPQPARGEPQSMTFEAETALVSNYLYRGETMSAGRPALQGQLTTVFGATGVYAELWGSTIARDAGADNEIDLTLGRRLRVAGLDLDVGASWFAYPGAHGRNYWELPVSASRVIGRWTLTAAAAYAPPQASTHARANLYNQVAVEWRPSGAPAFSASVGRENGAFASNKTDWSLGVARTFGPVALSLAYVGARARSTSATLQTAIRLCF